MTDTTTEHAFAQEGVAVKRLEVRVPSKFWDDHKSRDCSPSAIIVKSTKRATVVLLDEAALDDLTSDAKYYADENTADGDRMLIAMAASARATLRAIEKAVAK